MSSSTLTSNPLHILGGGLSGLTSAIALSRAGHQVHVHERNESAGKRFLGDLQGLENWTSKDNVLKELNSFGIHIDFEATPFNEITLTDGRIFIHRTSREPLFYLVKRGLAKETIDTCLQQQALNSGVAIHHRSTIKNQQAAIVATGPIRQALIANDKGLVFRTNLPNMAVGIFHDDFAYLGYSYLLVAQGYGCLCSVVFKDFHQLNRCFDNTVALVKRLYSINLDDAHPVGGIGSFSLNFPKQVGNTLFVGEAGGLQDLLWGFGMRTAMTSGYLAAQSLLNNQDFSTLIQQTFHSQLKASIVNRFIWEKMKIFQRPLIPFLVSFPSPLRTNFCNLYRFSFLHRLLYPLALRYVQKRYRNSIDFLDFTQNTKDDTYVLQS